MEHKNEVFTKVLLEIEYRRQLEEIIEIFKQNNILAIELVFGYAWGNTYKEWKSFEVSINSIQDEINTAEHLKVGRFGEDDLFIIYPSLDIEILFCHEKDIHLRYNDSNKLVVDVLDLWRRKGLLR